MILNNENIQTIISAFKKYEHQIRSFEKFKEYAHIVSRSLSLQKIFTTEEFSQGAAENITMLIVLTDDDIWNKVTTAKKQEYGFGLCGGYIRFVDDGGEFASREAYALIIRNLTSIVEPTISLRLMSRIPLEELFYYEFLNHHLSTHEGINILLTDPTKLDEKSQVGQLEIFKKENFMPLFLINPRNDGLKKLNLLIKAIEKYYTLKKINITELNSFYHIDKLIQECSLPTYQNNRIYSAFTKALYSAIIKIIRIELKNFNNKVDDRLSLEALRDLHAKARRLKPYKGHSLAQLSCLSDDELTKIEKNIIELEQKIPGKANVLN